MRIWVKNADPLIKLMERKRTKPMRQNIINCLEKLFSGSIDLIKITYYTPKSHDVIKFTMFGHGIREENGLITVYDNSENNNQIIPKTVNIDPLAVDDVTYRDDQDDSLGIYGRSVVIYMIDGSRIEMATMGMG